MTINRTTQPEGERMALKPCPFCGGPAGVGSDDAYDDVTWQAFCKHCHATIERDLKNHAIALWNTRAQNQSGR